MSPGKFNNQYYKNLQKKMGLLRTDQMLYADSRTSPFVNAMAYAPDSVFHNQFAASMTKFGNILDPEVQEGGEVRADCGYVNSYDY
ncbi:unnamed protein product [Linum tenue]|nr:unnamed protein product [Linum tenue]